MKIFLPKKIVKQEIQPSQKLGFSRKSHNPFSRVSIFYVDPPGYPNDFIMIPGISLILTPPLKFPIDVLNRGLTVVIIEKSI